MTTRLSRACALLVVFGFSTVFMLLGAGATFLGQLLLAYRYDLNIASGIVVSLIMAVILLATQETGLGLPLTTGRLPPWVTVKTATSSLSAAMDAAAHVTTLEFVNGLYRVSSLIRPIILYQYSLEF